jgi:hypothetical protein
MPGILTVEQRAEITLKIFPEIASLGIGYLIGHGYVIEAVLAGEAAPVDEATRKRIVEEAAKVQEAERP